MKIGEPSLQKNMLEVVVESESAFEKAMLRYTTDIGIWQARKCLQTPALIKKTYLSASLPASATAFYFNITDERKLTTSSTVTIIK